MSASPIGIALFGLGRAGLIHIGNLRRNHRCQVLYIVEPEVNRAIETVEKYHMKDTKVISPEEATLVYQDASVQAVVVCTPTFLHEDIVKKALDNAKAVFCEKPVSETLNGTKACYEAADDAQFPLFCSFNRRFDPSLCKLRHRVKAGECGKVHVVKVCSRDHPLPPMSYLKISGGIFHDCAVHDIDLICWILKEYPCSAFAQGIAHNKEIEQMGDVDTAVITLKFPSGVIAAIDLSRLANFGYDQRCEVFGSEGMLISENQYPTGVHHYDKFGTHMDFMKYSFPQRYAESYSEALEHFFNVVEGKEVLAIDKLNTLNVSRIASACEESVRSGMPVKLDLQQPNKDG